MENKKIVVHVIGIIVLLVVGFYAGTFFQSHSKTQLTKNQAVNTLSSKTVSSITAFGKVESINGKNITISNLGANLVISMTDNARIYSLIVPTEVNSIATPVQQDISFSDVKVGNNINVILKLLSDGQMQGQSLVVLP